MDFHIRTLTVAVKSVRCLTHQCETSPAEDGLLTRSFEGLFLVFLVVFGVREEAEGAGEAEWEENDRLQSIYTRNNKFTFKVIVWRIVGVDTRDWIR